MKKTEVVEALVQMRSAKQKWAVAQTAFTADFEAVMKRLINEAAVNKMSAEEVAKACGLTLKRVRQFMRENNLNPRNSKALLAKTAAETLETNAALLGVEPRDFDLTSPLAYLPMGSQLRDFLRNAVDPDEVLDPTEPRPGEREAWRQYEADNHPGNNDVYAFMMGYRAAYDAKQGASA